NLLSYKDDWEDSGPALVWNVTSVNSPLQSIDILGDTLTFNLIPEASGDDEVTLTLEDSDLAQDSTTFWVNISAVDDDPIIAPSIPHQLKLEDSPDWSLDLSTYKSDPEDPPGLLTWDVYDVDISKYSVNVNGDSLEFSLVPDANGDDLMYVNLTDSTNHVTEKGVWVNITPVNDAPNWDTIPNVVVTSNLTQDALTLRDYLSDIDTQMHNIGIELVSNSNSENINVTIDPNDKVDVVLETENYSGFAVINVSAYDGMDYAYGKFSVISIIGEVLADLRSPTDNSTVTTLTPKLMWSSAVPSGFAILEVVFDVYLDTNVTNVTTLNASALVSAAQTEESYTPSQPLIDQSDYYWTVIPKLIDSEGFTVFVGYCQDGVWNFTVDIFAPNSPPNVLLKSPANQTTVNSTTVELVWEAFDANGDWPLFYDIYLGPDQSDMTKILDKEPLSETNFTVEGLQEDGIFYWTVVPYDGVLTGVCLDGIWEFAINAENQPPIATLQAPLDGSQTGLKPELRWTAADSDPFDNVTYSVYLSETESDVTQYEPSALLRKDYTITSYTLTAPLEEGKTYYWTILPRDILENGSCDSGVWSFEVNTTITNQPPKVFLISPQDNQTVETLTGTVQLRWKGNDQDGDNITYTLFLGTNMTLVDGFDITMRQETDITAESYDATGLTNDTVYYWTVRPDDGELTGLCLNG
ncbi:MAG: fibronectin type III domain-containing protein, partial [Thermoplasmata archaeon]|nr:fibronectin type III domain-containing protein [Thermoplasmata archaeon]